MSKITLTISFLILFAQVGFCQEAKDFSQDSVIFLNSRKIDTTRYFGYKGSPYYFEDFVKGTIISNTFSLFEDLELNFNGYTGEFEIRNEGEFIELDKRWYVRIEVDPAKNESILKDTAKVIFQRGFHAKYLTRFGHILFNKNGVMLIKDFSVALSEKTIQDVGKTIEFKRFDPKHYYYLIQDGEARLIKPNKKGVVKALGYKSELEAFLKNEKLQLNEDADMTKLVAYYEALINA